LNILSRELLQAINGTVAYASKAGVTAALLVNKDGEYRHVNKLIKCPAGFKPIGYVSPTGGFLLVKNWSN